MGEEKIENLTMSIFSILFLIGAVIGQFRGYPGALRPIRSVCRVGSIFPNIQFCSDCRKNYKIMTAANRRTCYSGWYEDCACPRVMRNDWFYQYRQSDYSSDNSYNYDYNESDYLYYQDD